MNVVAFVHVLSTIIDHVTLRYVSDGTIAILMSMLFFVIPSRPIWFKGYGHDETGEILLLLLFFS